MTQTFVLIVLPLAAILLWIALRPGSGPLNVAFGDASELIIVTWLGLLAIAATIYFRTH